MKKIIFTLPFEMKKFFLWGWSEWNDSSENVNKPQREVEASVLEITMQGIIEELSR